MALNEGPCYTIINSKDSEPFNEMQIKQDLGNINHIHPPCPPPSS